MPTAPSLIRALLQDAALSDAAALAIIEAAADMTVDPIDYCVHRYGITGAEALQRAAGWAGLPYSATLPAMLEGSAVIQRIDALAEVRTLRTTIDGRDIVYCAPRFEEMLALARHVAEYPQRAELLCIVPIRALRSELASANAPLLLDESRQRLARRWPYASAHLDLPFASRVIFVAGVVGAVVATALAPFWFKPAGLPLIAILLGIPAGIRWVAAARLGAAQPLPAPLLSEAELPIYSVLIPLRDEAHMVTQLQQAMRGIDYPPEKLDIKFLVESRSAATVGAVEAALSEQVFELVVIPDALPHTKPKALNYALPLVRGEYVVVYDAEDIPAPDQLKRAASELAAEPGLDCLQAELHIDNARENLLTALFAGEYAGQFGLLLPCLAWLRLPMPLGGTSNHFRTSSLREMGGWDAFNVTEDADVGTRMSRLRYRTATLPSRTREEAPISLSAWMAQRTRWTKGWMQTFIVHNRAARRFLKDMGWRDFLAFEIYIGNMIMSALLHSVFLVSFAISLVLGSGGELIFDVWDGISIVLLAIGYGGAVAIVVMGLVRLRQPSLLTYQLALPLYWLLHSIATVRALHELLFRPYFWAKTRHGLTAMSRSPGLEPIGASGLASGEVTATAAETKIG